jgi:Zn-dependent protease
MSHETLLLLPLWYVVFLLSVTCHEAGHAWAAHLGGDDTAYLGGQVSLNPLPHIRREPWGTVLVPLLSFVWAGWMMGWASAPYDPSWEDRHPRRASAMAAAGPLANLALAAIGFAVLKWGLATGVWQPPATAGFDRLVEATSEATSGWNGLARFCSVLFSLNLLLFVFNLIPVPPLDGLSVLAGLFESVRRLRDRLLAQPMTMWIGLLLAWVLFPRVFGYVFRYVLFGALYG